MAKLDIITLPDPLLRQKSAPIEQVDDDLRRLMDSMLETMYVAPGIGLAAVQVAIPKRLIVVDVGKEASAEEVAAAKLKANADAEVADGDDGTAPEELLSGKPAPDKPAPDKPAMVPNPICMVNPEIIMLGDDRGSYEEGCLSLPEVLVDIERPKSLTVRYVDREGKQQELEAAGLLATVIQHEVDHLDGKLIIDFLSRLKRDMVIRKFKKMKRGAPTM